jgi:hypothetical protein
MFAIIFSLFHSIRQGLRVRAALHAEILALRHQLLVLQRSKRSHKFQLGLADRIFWIWFSQLWSSWRPALVIVKPETVIAWHRRGFRLYWSWRSRHRQGRPSISKEVIDLIHKMSSANPRWGAPRIHGELLKLGFEIAESTVAKYMVRRRRPSSQTWCTFLAKLRGLQRFALSQELLRPRFGQFNPRKQSRRKDIRQAGWWLNRVSLETVRRFCPNLSEERFDNVKNGAQRLSYFEDLPTVASIGDLEVFPMLRRLARAWRAHHFRCA